MEDIKTKLTEADELVYDPAQDAQAASASEAQPMTNSMPPVAPAVEATPAEVNNATQAAAVPTEGNTVTTGADTAAAEDALNTAADNADSNVVTLEIKFDKRDLMKDGFLVPDAEGASANPAAQLAANPNVQVPPEPLASVGTTTETEEQAPAEGEDLAPQMESIQNHDTQKIQEGFFKDFFKDMADAVIAAGKEAGKDDNAIQAELDAKYNLLKNEPMFQDIDLPEECEAAFCLNKKDGDSEDKPDIAPMKEPEGEDPIKDAGDEAGKSEFKASDNDNPLAMNVFASEIAKSKMDSYESITPSEDIVKQSGNEPGPNKNFEDASTPTEYAQDIKGEKQDSYDSPDFDKDKIKQATSDITPVRPDFLTKEDKELIKEYHKYKSNKLNEAKITYELTDGKYQPWSGAVYTWETIEQAGKIDELDAFIEELYPEGITETDLNDMLWFDRDYVLESLGLSEDSEHIHESAEKEESNEEVESDSGKEHLEDVAHADMDSEDMSPEEVASLAAEKEEEAPIEEPKEAEPELPTVELVNTNEESHDSAEDEDSDKLLKELDNVLADIYNNPPAYNMNVNINTDDKEKAAKGAVEGLNAITDFVNAVLADESDPEIEDTAEDVQEVPESHDEESKEESKAEVEESPEAEEPEVEKKPTLEESVDNVAIGTKVEDSDTEDCDACDMPEGMKVDGREVYVDDDLVGFLGGSGEAVYNPIDRDHPEVTEYFMSKDYTIHFRAQESMQKIKEGVGAGYFLTVEGFVVDPESVEYKKMDDGDYEFTVDIKPGTYGYAINHPDWHAIGDFNLTEGYAEGWIPSEFIEEDDLKPSIIDALKGMPWERDDFTWSVKDLLYAGSTFAVPEETFVLGDNTKDINSDTDDTNILFITKVEFKSDNLASEIQHAHEHMYDEYDDSADEEVYAEMAKEQEVEPEHAEEPESSYHESIDANCNDLIKKCEERIKERRKAFSLGATENVKFNEALKQAPQKPADLNLNANSWNANKFIDHYKESRALNFQDLLKKGILG